MAKVTSSFPVQLSQLVALSTLVDTTYAANIGGFIQGTSAGGGSQVWAVFTFGWFIYSTR